MEWTTQSEEQPPVPDYPPGNGDTQPLPTSELPSHPAPEPGHYPEESHAPPVTNAPPPIPTHAIAAEGAPQAPAGFDHCPSCGSLVASDQRYCLECGHRRGDPRLPFMDAVVFMDAMKRPPEAASTTTKAKKRGISPNAALIAGVGTLLLALGIGVLIGRSGDQGSTQASQAPIVIKGGAGAEEEATAAAGGAGATTGGGSSDKGKSKKQIVKEKAAAAASGEGAEEVLHTVPGVKMAPPTQKIGGKCDKEVAGCSKSGNFDGSFFGEE